MAPGNRGAAEHEDRNLSNRSLSSGENCGLQVSEKGMPARKHTGSNYVYEGGKMPY